MNEQFGSTKQVKDNLGLLLLKRDNMDVGFVGGRGVIRTLPNI